MFEALLIATALPLGALVLGTGVIALAVWLFDGKEKPQRIVDKNFIRKTRPTEDD